ncbi:uncharacterized protein HMPREF1541_09800 [Cyphellophora europaea CBS 101466]|uniref:Uncharacterized protein n=1 Tax=Cyphellophora europaea (strain CBS 101466) TaxID=1220924 RepID=W2S8H8_CYPE1|nr:uncharacterized protein HMPREF1541_09800 [Cyphellophora europaea CBS 101466]ETN44925.1 hypothetical protein HMPREF1541_09800 [Cyphellophora europaea CBS 101466]
MPSLRNITCQVVWPEGTPFKEVATTYGDGIVETFIPIPASKPQKFSIRVRSKGYIYDGLAVIVFIDGVYQCNRNRINLVRPKKGQPVKRTEIDFRLRQEEKKLDKREYFLGSDWRFDDYNTVGDLNNDVTEQAFQGLGTIDVVVLRCCPRPADAAAPDDYASGAESDVLGNKLTEDDFPPPTAAKPAKDSGAASREKGSKCKPAGGGDKGGKGKDEAGGQKTDKGSKRGEEKPKPAPTGEAFSDSDSDNDDTSIPAVDGPADRMHRHDDFYHNPHWPGPAHSDRYGYYDQPPHPRSPPPHSEKHVHFDYGQLPEYPAPPDQRYSDHGDLPHRSHYTRGLSQHAGYGYEANPGYDARHRYPPHPAVHCSYTPPGGVQSAHPRIPLPVPPYGYPSQAGVPRHPNRAWWSQQGQHMGYGGPHQHGQQSHQSPSQQNSWVWDQTAMKWVPAAEPPTTEHYNGWSWDQTKQAWVASSSSERSQVDPSKSKGVGEKTGDPGNNYSNTSSTNDNNGTNSGWGNNDSSKNTAWSKNNEDKADDDGNKSSDSWNQDNNGNTSWGSDNKDSNTANDANSGWETAGSGGWGDDKKDEPSGGGSSNNTQDDWGNRSMQSTQNDTSHQGGAATSTEEAPRTYHGPYGAYHGPKLAVEPYGDLPWIADEPPRYDIPDSIAKSIGLSKQVQRGRGYNYYKRHRKPIYIDTIEEPYARFVFKYRTRDKLPRGFDQQEGLEPTPDAITQGLQDQKKEDLIAELQRWRMAYGDKAPKATFDSTKIGGRSEDIQAWNADPPARSYIKYSLPGHFPADESNSKTNTAGGANGSMNGDTGSANDNWSSNNNTTSSGNGTTDGNDCSTGNSGSSWDSQPQAPKHGW